MSEANTPRIFRLYLIRHGAVEDAAAGKLLGFTDPCLSEQGLAQAARLADDLASAKLAAIYSSDLLRASQTAEAIGKHHRLSVQRGAAFREINMGEWEDRTMASIYEESPKMVEHLFTDPGSFKYPGGESFADFTARVRVALEELMASHPSGQIAIVAHGGVCRAIMGTVLEMPMRAWLRLAQDHCCLNVIEWYDANPVLKLLNGGLGSSASARSNISLSESSQCSALVEGEDYYYEKGMMVFTARHHLRRGYCCENNCRHCPYREAAIG